MSTPRHSLSRPALRTRRRLAWPVALGLLALIVLLCAWSSVPLAHSADRASDDPPASAAEELEAVRARAAQTRAVAEKAKRDLDRYVARHFDEQQQRAEEPVFVPDFPKPAAQPETLPPSAVETEWLFGQIQRLKLERSALLSRYTPAHPQVIELDVRLADLRRQLTEAHDDRPGDADGPDGEEIEQKVKREWTDRISAEKDYDRESAIQYRKALTRWQKAERQARAAAEAEAAAAERLSAAEAARNAELATEQPPAEAAVPQFVEPAEDYRRSDDEAAPPVSEPPQRAGPESLPPERAPAVESPIPARPSAPIEPQTPTQPAVPLKREGREQTSLDHVPIPSKVEPARRPTVRMVPPEAARVTPIDDELWITQPEAEIERPPATYYPAESFVPDQEAAPNSDSPAKPRATRHRRRVATPVDSWIEAAPGADVPGEMQPAGERLISPRQVPAASPKLPSVDATTLVPTPWSDEPLFESNLTSEALLDEPFLLEHESHGALDEVAETDVVRNVAEGGATPEGDDGQTVGDSASSEVRRWQRYSDGSSDPRDGGGAGSDSMESRGRRNESRLALGDSADRGDMAAPEMAGEGSTLKRASVSRPLALAAIIAAIVVAALASIWLARSSRDRSFATADDVSAELDLPLVGVVPPTHALTPSRPRRSLATRGVILLGQVVLAVAIFGAVAYAISTPGLVERVCSHSVATLDRAWSAVRTR